MALLNELSVLWNNQNKTSKRMDFILWLLLLLLLLFFSFVNVWLTKRYLDSLSALALAHCDTVLYFLGTECR